MYSWLVRSLGNISVSLKLGIGFGLVLLLTIVITLTGWLGMTSLIERSDKLASITLLNDLSRDLRVT